MYKTYIFVTEVIGYGDNKKEAVKRLQRFICWIRMELGHTKATESNTGELDVLSKKLDQL